MRPASKTSPGSLASTSPSASERSQGPPADEASREKRLAMPMVSSAGVPPAKMSMSGLLGTGDARTQNGASSSWCSTAFGTCQPWSRQERVVGRVEDALGVDGLVQFVAPRGPRTSHSPTRPPPSGVVSWLLVGLWLVRLAPALPVVEGNG